MPGGLIGNYEELSDEETPLNQEIYGGSRRSAAETTKAWDSFRNLPPGTNSLSEETADYMGVTVKILKIFTYLLTFSIVLGCAVITKGLVLLMTSQLQAKKKLTVCSDSYKSLHNEIEYEATIPPLENVAWAWALFFCFIIPELGTWFRSTRMCLFKSWKKPLAADFFIVFLFETFHVIGTALLIYKVLPDLDVIKGAMLTNCFCFIPGFFGLCSRNKGESRVYIKVVVDIIALCFQISGFFVWPFIEYRKNPQNTQIWLIPVAIFLMSFGWWENYVDKQSKFRPIKFLGRIKERMWRSRYFIYIFISLWKCLVFFGLMILFMFTRLNDISVIFNVSGALSAHIINVTELKPPLSSRLPDIGQVAPLDNIIQIPSDGSTPMSVLILQVLMAYFTYIFAKFACKICIQGFSFAFPVNLTVPVSISLLITACGLRLGNHCYFESIPSYLFWECKGGDILEEFLSEDYAWMWLFWLLSQTWITLHIWTPKCERLASTERLFVAPMYNSLFIDQSLALNRRRDDEAEVKTDDINLNADENEPEPQYYETISNHTDSSTPNNSKSKSSDHITRIYATATMWHETEEEMMEMLKSILRMDEDQSARRITQKYLEVVDPDYYEFETHIFFDDSFEISDDNEDEHVVNSFVKLLVDKIDQAATHVHQIMIRIRPPKKFPAPYGGRLVWTLPGKTKIICHLKDKDKIRHKKRWSQVMYMYYLLGFKLMELPIPVDRKEIIAENTYLLTLDGDIDFTPKAVTLLVDLMKKNTNLGAACGRIHPVGSGIMVWYQMFEYAIGHWLQKATEHMIGCVMCSPGCFSLFRGKALMDDNVMAKYTTKSSQARHYVQYDQGEDRWLCTLLLQRGYRVEYSAASDAYTHCPEGFGEFYNQRRRWVPSTMANIMDLLQDYKKTIQINDNISLPYICYQTMLMGGTILGPGTIFLMLVGAFVAAFKIGNWPSFQYNIYPILLFMLVCFTLKSDHQVIVAQIMSASYGLIMMAVIVGTTLQLGEDGVGSPSFIFLIALSGSFFIAACMHPQEFKCIIPGLLYLLSIPSMYLLLIIYSLINLNNVSWGTREVATKKTKKEQEADRKAAEEAKKKQKAEGLLGFLYRDKDAEDEGSIELSVAGLFKIMFCVHPKPDDRKHVAEALDDLKKKMESIEASLGLVPPHRRRSDNHMNSRHIRNESHSINETGDDDFDDDDSQQSGPKIKRDDLINPYWIEDKCLKRGVVGEMDKTETQFWKDLIDKYLYPLNKNVEEQRKAAAELKDLRNISVFSFTMLNAIFVLIVFLLQLNKDKIHVQWPLGIKQNITIDPTTQEILISKEYLQLEPIGLVFVFFFALILVIQFVAMLFHRFGTISHILASTELNLCSKKPESMTPDSKLEMNAVKLVKDMQRLKGLDGSGDGDEIVGRRHPIANIERHRQKKQPIGTLDVAFMKRFYSISKENGEGTPILGGERRENLRALFERRKSKVQTLDYRKNNKTRPSIASEADNQRVFTPNGGSVNEGYESENEIYGAPPTYRSINSKFGPV